MKIESYKINVRSKGQRFRFKSHETHGCLLSLISWLVDGSRYDIRFEMDGRNFTIELDTPELEEFSKQIIIALKTVKQDLKKRGSK